MSITFRLDGIADLSNAMDHLSELATIPPALNGLAQRFIHEAQDAPPVLPA